MGASEEIVVVVHDTGRSWVAQVAAVVRAAGCLVGLVTADPANLASLVDRMATVDDPTDPGAVAAAARRLARGARIGAVLSGNDGCVAGAAAAAELLGVGRSPAHAVARTRDKHATRRALRDAGLPGPRYALLSTEEDAQSVADDVGLPAVVKPVNGTGSHLVLAVDSVPALAAAYRTLAARVPAADVGRLYARPLAGGAVDPRRSFLVESRLSGREYCVDVIVRDGAVEQLPLIDKALVDERFFELGFALPPLDLPAHRAAGIRAAVADAVRAVGLDNTVAHIEVIDDERAGPTIVEINGGRPGGPSPHTLYRLTAGIDMVAEAVAVARGVPAPRTAPLLPTPLASLNVFAAGTGRLTAIHGLDRLAEHPDVLHVVAARGAGDAVSHERETHVLLVVVAGFLDAADLASTYDEVSTLVRLEVAV
ncbi:ATP-grasp domain-containing protein [Actinomycetes bacterium KLBMP 9797]